MQAGPPNIPPRGFTARALVVGGLLSAFLGLACPYSVLVMRTAGLTSDYATPGAMMLVFVLVALVNPLLKLLFGPRAFSSSELVLIYTMLILASAVPTWGLVTNLLHILTRPVYYATPENAWTEIILPHVPTWLAPHESSLASDSHNGLPRGEAIPWRGCRHTAKQMASANTDAATDRVIHPPPCMVTRRFKTRQGGLGHSRPV